MCVHSAVVQAISFKPGNLLAMICSIKIYTLVYDVYTEDRDVDWNEVTPIYDLLGNPYGLRKYSVVEVWPESWIKVGWCYYVLVQALAINVTGWVCVEDLESY